MLITLGKVVIILIGIGIYMLILHCIQKKSSIPPEWIRKALHVGGGLLSTMFPFIFYEIWPVWLLCAALSLLLILIRYRSLFSSGLGKALKDINRESMGEVYFPISIALLWSFSLHNILLYIIPLLILTFADTIATLIGIYYGMLSYKSTEGTKSTEGSIAFFLVAFFCTHIPLLLFSDIPRINTLLISILLGFLLMLFEAIAWRGIDNFFIPIFGFFILKSLLSYSSSILGLHLIILSIYLIIVLFWRTRSTLSDNALLVCALFAYFCWATAGLAWVFVPILLFLSYASLSPKTKKDRFRLHNLQAVSSIIIPSIVWIIFYKIFSYNNLFFPFLTVYSTQLIFISYARFKRAYPDISNYWLILNNLLFGLIFFMLFWIINGIHDIKYIIFGSLGMLIGFFIFKLLEPKIENYSLESKRWLHQGICGFIASIISIIPIIL